MPRLTLPRGARVTLHAEVRRILDLGRSGACGEVVVYAFDRGDARPARVALVVGRKWGDAVRRNRVRRKLRDAFRVSRPALAPGFDMALLPRGAIGPLRGDDLRSKLVSAARQAVRRFRESGPKTAPAVPPVPPVKPGGSGAPPKPPGGESPA